MPFGGTLGLGGGNTIPDFDPGDLARIEVLRGPQGTLYGAASMGGLIKFVTADPSTTGYSGRVQVGTSTVQNGAELGYTVRASVNAPLSDTLAIRASGFTLQVPGYIDSVSSGTNGTNRARDVGGQLSALWRPTDAFSLKLNTLYQDYRGDGSNDTDVLPGLRDLQQNELRGTGAYERKTQAYSAVINAKVGSASLTSVTGYGVYDTSQSDDFSSTLGGLGPASGLYNAAGAALPNDDSLDKFSQEVRLTLPFGARFEWLLGAFYTHEFFAFSDSLLPTDPTTGTVVAQPYSAFETSSFTEYAAFSTLTFHVTDRFDVQMGGRGNKDKNIFKETEYGPLVQFLHPGSSPPHISPDARSDVNAFTYLLTPQFRVSPDLMLYARIASGYRPGGANQLFADTPSAQYSPDKTKNYEIGLKGDLLDHELSIDASVYYIDWKNLQLSLATPDGFSYTGNTGAAKSEGVELSVTAKPLPGLTVATWLAYSDAVLTQDLPPASVANGVYGVSGDRLPYNERWSGNASFAQDFSLWGGASGFVGGDVSYVGNRLGEFQATPVRQYYSPYAKTDLRAGVKYNSWTATVFATNITDRRGVVSGGLGNVPSYGFVLLQPRTIGLNLMRRF